MSSSIMLHIVFEAGLSVNLELAGLAKLTGQQAQQHSYLHFPGAEAMGTSHQHLAFDTDGTWALGEPVQLPVVLESRHEMSTAYILKNPQPLQRNAGMKSLMPYEHAISLIALPAGILKSGNRYSSLANHGPFYL